MQTRMLVIHALTPMHAGTGQGTGHIDLPIQRERASRHPLLPGSSIKGSLRDLAESALGRGSREVVLLFGPDFLAESDQQPADADDPASARRPLPHQLASALRFSDARVLLFPVQSDRGTFAWVTCPYVLERLRRDMGTELSGLKAASPAPTPPQGKDAAVAKDSVLVDRPEGQGGGRLVLDGLTFDAGVPKGFDRWASDLAAAVFPGTDAQATLWQSMLRQRLCIVGDDAFTWFVEQATEVRARVRIDDASGTVKGGMLWYEECLPAESVLAGVVQHVPQKRDALSDAEAFDRLGKLVAEPIQLGGKATVGHGVARVNLVGGAG